MRKLFKNVFYFLFDILGGVAEIVGDPSQAPGNRKQIVKNRRRQNPDDDNRQRNGEIKKRLRQN